ncbi:MAG: M48 family metalloprotease, partial [Candidatus Anstonellales archaeon]
MPFYAIDKKELFSEIEANKRKVELIFLIAFSTFVLAIPAVTWWLFVPALNNEKIEPLLISLLTYLSIFMCLAVIIFMRNDPLRGFKLILNKMQGIIQLTTPNTPEEKMLSDIVDEIVIAGLVEKRPEVYIIETDEPNAFAVSKGNDSIIVVTRGIMKLMNRAELSAVIAHELSHIMNKDSEVKLLIFLFTYGLIYIVFPLLVADVIMEWGWRSPVSSGPKKGSISWTSLPALLILLFILLFSFLFITVFVYITLLILFFIVMSKKQERKADIRAVKLTRDKEVLISALRKLGGYEKSELEKMNPLKNALRKLNKWVASEQAKKLKPGIGSSEMVQKAVEEQEIQKGPYDKFELYKFIPPYMFFWQPEYLR